MPQTLEEMTPDLLALTPAERAEAATLLIDSLGKPPRIWSEDDPDFDAELQRRCESVANGTAKLVPYEEVMQQLEAMLNQ
jgi:putative addiction module component (TIGR02574 family)